ncbi:hypothetical protein Chor_009308 [Crotalus horridus]
MGDAGEKVLDNDAEGVWSPDIEQSFQEALAIYPPCRNELIARYIKLRTGKTRTRKQVSSHIQVLARRKTREIQAKLKDQVAKDKALQSMAAMSSAQLVSAAILQEKLGLSEAHYPPSTTTCKQQHRFVHIDPTPTSESALEMVDVRQIYDKFPEKGEPGGTGGIFYGVSSRYEGPRALTLSCTSKVCSFGKQVVEKLETAEPPHWEDGRFVFRMQRSPLCEYLINFIRKLQTLPEKPMMDSVLENFTILQVLRDQETQELLLCVAFVFEVSASERGAQHHIYQLGRD